MPQAVIPGTLDSSGVFVPNPAGVATAALQAAGNAAFSNSNTNITTATTTTVKSGAGSLHLVTVNTLGTIASTVTIYDSLTGSGTKLATIDSLTLKGSFFYDVAFATGLTIVTTGTAAPDISVAFR